MFATSFRMSRNMPLKTSFPLSTEVTRSFWWIYGRQRRTMDVDTLEDYYKAVEQNEGKLVFALFHSSPDKITGESWCPDCATADPVIEACAKKLPKNSVLIRCAVGQRDEWKDPNNVFRNDPKLRLTCIPTLIKVSTQRRLLEKQCADKNLVEMFFEED